MESSFSPLLLLFFFSLGHCKPRGGRNLSLCAWQEWGDDWRCALRFREVLIYPAPLGGTQGIAKWSSKSRVLTHSLFFWKKMGLRNGQVCGLRSSWCPIYFIPVEISLDMLSQEHCLSKSPLGQGVFWESQMWICFCRFIPGDIIHSGFPLPCWETFSRLFSSLIISSHY